MNLIFYLSIKSKDKLYETKMLGRENYKVFIIMGFLLHQSIVPKILLVDTLLNIGNLLEL
jgi:hypothetical protein